MIYLATEDGLVIGERHDDWRIIRRGLEGRRAGAAGMMERGAGLLQRLAKRVEMVVEPNQQMFRLALEELGVDVVAQPDQERRKIGLDQREDEIGYAKRQHGWFLSVS